VIGVADGDQGAQRDGVRAHVGDRQQGLAFVPELVGGAEPLQLGPEQRHREGGVRVDEDGAEQLEVAAAPVLDVGLDELGDGDHQAALVPELDDDVGEVDLLDVAQLVLELDQVTDAHRLGDGELDAGDDAREGFLGCEAQDRHADAGGGQQREAEVAHHLELHQEDGAGGHQEQDRGDAPGDGEPGAQRAALELPDGIVGESPLVDERPGVDEAEQQPGAPDDIAGVGQVPRGALRGPGEVELGAGELEEDHPEEQPHRAARRLEQHVVPGGDGALGQSVQAGGHRGGDERGEDPAQDQAEGEPDPLPEHHPPEGDVLDRVRDQPLDPALGGRDRQQGGDAGGAAGAAGVGGPGGRRRRLRPGADAREEHQRRRDPGGSVGHGGAL
jgi:hypothetical protein